MQLTFVLLTLLLLAVALFALQNPEPVTVRFWPWRIQSSVAILTLASTATGALIAALLGVTARLVRWSRGRVARPPAAPPGPDAT